MLYIYNALNIYIQIYFIYLYILIYIYIYTYMHIYISVYLYLYLIIYLSIYIYLYIYLCIYIYLFGFLFSGVQTENIEQKWVSLYSYKLLKSNKTCFIFFLSSLNYISTMMRAFISRKNKKRFCFFMISRGLEILGQNQVFIDFCYQ